MRPHTGRSGLALAVAAVLCVAMLWTTNATAQQASAKIVGTAIDQQGLVVAGVKVTVTNTATDVSSTTTTDKTGFYQVLNLPIGTYKIIASHEGFRTVERTTAPLEINQALRVDIKLEVGALSEKVLVEGQAESVETVNPTIGQSVTSRPIVNMPLNGRDVLDLALLQPGVSESNPDDGSAGHYSVGGGRSDSVTFLLDGGINNDLTGNGVVFDPNPDTVAEFRILTSNYTAEYGRNGAGVVSVVTKSGTNQLHGSIFEFARNTAFDGNSYFNIQNGLPRNDLKRHQFGGTFGGPITIPHLVDGKDRMFFFVSYQGQRQTEAVGSTTTTFTKAELNGDFSQAGPNGGPDPNVVCFLTGYFPDGTGCKTDSQGNPIPGPVNSYFSTSSDAANGIIDTIDPAAQNYIATGLIPTTTDPTGFLAETAAATDNNNEFTGKLDFNFTSKDRLSATLGGRRSTLVDPFAEGDNTVAGVTSKLVQNSYFLNIAYTRTFSPTLLNEFRATAQRLNDSHNLPVTGNQKTANQLGFGILSDLPKGPPNLFFDTGLELGSDYQGPAYLLGNTFAYSDTVTWVKGHNSWKFGAGFSNYQNNTLYDFLGDGILNFGFAGPTSSGNSLADFLLGLPNSLNEGPNARNNIRTKATYGFAQDEWRVRKNLVLSLGMRYEYSTPKSDTARRSFSIVPGAQSTRFPLAPVGLLFPGDSGAPRGVNFPDKDNFAPRIGFAWDPRGNGKMSIRGGIGLFYDVLKGEDNLQFNGAPPFYSESTANYGNQNTLKDPFAPYTASGGIGTPYYFQPWTTAGFVVNPFPSPVPGPTTSYSTATGNALPFGASGVWVVAPHIHTPYTYQYNLSIQEEVARNLTFEANYVGSSSKGLTSTVDVNPFDLTTVNGLTPTRILNYNQNQIVGSDPVSLSTFCNTANSITGVTLGGPAQCPFSSLLEFGNLVFAGFNSLEASLTKQNGDNRYIGNTYFTLGYTWAHSIDNSSGFRNRSSEVPYYHHYQFRGSSDFDLTNRIVFSGGWDLPFDRLTASAPRRLVKGWSLYPIFSWRTGFPLSINGQLSTAASNPGPSGAGDAGLTNVVFAPGVNHITITDPRKNNNQYFDPSAFICDQFGDPCIPQAGQPYFNNGYGLPRNFFRGPGRTNLDLAMAKTTAITERSNAEFRVEAFNLFNHAEFDNPDTNVFSSTFGQITDTDIGIRGAHTERILQLALRLTF